MGPISRSTRRSTATTWRSPTSRPCIVYELVRLRYLPSRLSARCWRLTAAALWLVVKLPHEYWIHVEQRDFTATIADHPVVGLVCALVVLCLAVALWLVVRRRLPDPDWTWRIAADPLTH